MTSARIVFIATLASACSAPPPRAAEPEPVRPPDSAVPAPTSTQPAPGASAASPATEITSTASAPAPAPAASAPAFPPPAFEPPHAKSAAPGDGQWARVGDAALRERAADAPVMYKTVVHPHPTSRFMSLTVAALDLSRLELAWLPGTGDVDVKKVPAGFTLGLVPPEQQDRLIAVFNGGFQPQHGRWGLSVGTFEIQPPKPHGCTIVVLSDGNVRIQTWSALREAAAQYRVVRQTPPCLLESGSLHAELTRGNEKPWGGNTADVVTRRRSALGIDKSGRVLLYGVGVEVGARLLAEGMRAAGAESAAELDINWNWTRFLLYGTDVDGALKVSSTLIPEMVHGKTSYVQRAIDRDFFYLLRKP